MTAQFPPTQHAMPLQTATVPPRALHPKYRHVGMLPPRCPHLPRHPKPRTKNSASNHGSPSPARAVAPPKPPKTPDSPLEQSGPPQPGSQWQVSGKMHARTCSLCTQGCGRSEERKTSVKTSHLVKEHNPLCKDAQNVLASGTSKLLLT